MRGNSGRCKYGRWIEGLGGRENTGKEQEVLAANKGGRGAQLGAVSRSAYYSGFIVGVLQ